MRCSPLTRLITDLACPGGWYHLLVLTLLGATCPKFGAGPMAKSLAQYLEPIEGDRPWLAKHLNEMHRVFAPRVKALDVDDWLAEDEQVAIAGN